MNGSGYHAAVPLDLPPARGGLPITVQIVYTEHGVGAAGRGWDVPLSYVRRDTTIVRRRPVGVPNVAPQGPEQVTLVLDGRTVPLVRTASGWSARYDAPDLQIQHPDDATWLVYDGQGRTYRFAAVSALLSGTGMWLLQDESGADGAALHLDYDVGTFVFDTTSSLSQTTVLTIDLIRVSYNPSPWDARCYKHAVALSYDSPVTPPLSFASLGSTALVRRHKLTSIEVSARGDCSSNPVRLRQYQLAYQADGDTQQPRLQEVRMVGQGQAGADPSPIPVASYTYGTATMGGRLNYESVSNATNIIGAGYTIGSTPARPNLGVGSMAGRAYLDVTGDGRPDVIEYSADDGRLTYLRNESTGAGMAMAPRQLLSDATLTPRAVNTQTAQTELDPSSHISYSRVWRQAIDMNGDGRVDILDAAEQAGHWVIYLNTPDPGNPATVRWVRRSVSIASLAQQLANRGMASDAGFLPLARRARGWNGNSDTGADPGTTSTLTEWEVKDLNGDGYPDVVFNSSRAVVKARDSGLPRVFYDLTVETAHPVIEAVFNVRGTHLTDGNDEMFSAPVTLWNQDSCAVEEWLPDGPNGNKRYCAITDVNGDGLPDRVVGPFVRLGLGDVSSGQFFMLDSAFDLPGILEVYSDTASSWCRTSASFTNVQTGGLIDLTGDGILDYVAHVAGESNFSVAIGTGMGFTSPVQSGGVAASVSISSESCSALGSSHIDAAWIDLDGDGKLDYISNLERYMLRGPDGRGAPSAGRLTGIDNGFGARTSIHYRSIKGDTGTLHQVPFAEIVVDSVDTAGTQGFGGSLSATRYAYGGAELAFDPASDGFRFPGYRRTVMLQAPVGQPAGVGTILITDTYAPVSAVDPYGVAGGTTSDAAQRYAQYRRIGRTRDITVLTGNFGADALTSPSSLVGIDVTSDARRIGAAHYEWNARLLTSSSDPPGPETCIEAVFPYDHAGSATFSAGHAHYDPCIARGFVHMASVQSWRGAPGAAPPSAANVETRSEITRIDDFGRVLSVRQSNDLHRDDDDLCTDTTFATPTTSPERMLSAVAAHTVSDCGSTVLASERFEYDRLSPGNVSLGHLTSHIVDRRSDTGALLDTIRRFDATYDSSGNLHTVQTQRDDGISRLDDIEYDPFGLAVASVSTIATNLGPRWIVQIDRDPISLRATTTTDANGVRRGTSYDSFGREVLTTITPPGGAAAALSCTSYLGFAGGDTQGRRVVQTRFPDPVATVDVATACASPGYTTTVFLDELGRARREESALGASYAGLTLISQRTYDGLGRVVFEADPLPSNQSFGTAYGTTSFFNPDGTPSCVVRGNGPQAAIPAPTSQTATDPAATDEAHEIYPTCVQRTYQDHGEVVSVRDAASLLAGSPQYGVVKTSYATATGNVLARSTWQGQSRLEHATFAYDRLGHMTAMTRYQDAAGAANPVTSSWHHDSLSQLVELDEPGASPRFYRYDSWGELVRSSRYPDAPAGAWSPGEIPFGLLVITSYDALGRVTQSLEMNHGVVDPETSHSYFYDQARAIAPQVAPTYVNGRLSQATSATGAVSFSYDAFGRVNARVFTDTDGGTHVEKRAYHGDGTLQSLDLFLPDTGFAREHVEYTYDSAGRGGSVTYTGASGTKTLYQASLTDALGRVRQARYGSVGYQASYAESGRRLLNRANLSLSGNVRTLSFPDYDPLGRERSRTEIKTTGSSTSRTTITSTTSHVYDALGRLSSSVRATDGPVGFNQQFAYDPLGNLTRQWDASGATAAPDATLRYLDSDRDRICRIAYGDDSGTDCNVTYDDVGAITSQPTPTGTRRYGYLINGSVRTIDDDQTSAHLRYDAFGEIQELEVTSGAPPRVLATEHRKRYGELIELRLAASGSTQLRRKIPIFNGTVATLLGPSFPFWAFSLGEERGTRFTFDELGLFTFDTDYWPYGKPSFASFLGGNLANNEQWNDGYYLSEFGLSLLGARVYDPAIGRFLSRDPLLIPRTAATSNPYAFANNDPINASDPSGLCPKWVDFSCPEYRSEPETGWNSGWGMGEGTGFYTPGTVAGSGPSSGEKSSIGDGPVGSNGGRPGGSDGGNSSVAGSSPLSGAYQPAASAVFGATSVSPTPLPWEPGKQPDSLYIGNFVHNAIAKIYIAAHRPDPVFANSFGITRILKSMPGAKPQDVNPLFLQLRPDLVNLETKEIYEIKPVELYAEALVELAMYRAIFAAAGVPLMPGSPLASGVTGVIPAPGGIVIYGSPSPGIITYSYLPGGLSAVREPNPVRARDPSKSYWRQLSEVTGLSGAALAAYLIISEGTRLFPPRNLIPAP